MPTNLNALIRYKTINNCLSTGRKYDIGELTDACSEALSEYCGRETAVSERTIRDDIRVLRSDILGFNAPIRQKDGLYYYDNPLFSIMSVGITDTDLINRIIRLLFEIREKVSHPELESVLKKLLQILPEETSAFNTESALQEMQMPSGPEPGKIRPSAKPGMVRPEVLWGDVLNAIHGRN